MLYLKDEYDERDGGLLFSVLIGGFIIAALTIQLIVAAVASGRGVTSETVANTGAAPWLTQGGLYLILLGVVIFYHRSNKINFVKATGLNKKFSFADVVMSVILGTGMLLTFLIITFLFSYLLQQIGYKSAGGSFEINNAGTFLAAIFIICFLPAVVEETVFRGAVLKGYSKVFSIITSVILSSVFFMLMHMNLAQFMNALLTGIVMGLLVNKTKTIKASMIVHFVNNFVITLITFIQSLSPSEPASELLVLNKESLLSYGLLFAIGLVLFVPALIYFFTKRPYEPKEQLKEKTETDFDNNIYSANQTGIATTTRKKKAIAYAGFGIVIALLFTILNAVL